MNGTEDFLESPESGRRRNRPPRRRAGGFIKHFILMLLMGVVFLIACLVIVDMTNSGGKIKEALIGMLGGEKDEPKALEPETKIVEKVVEVPVEKVVEKVVEKIVEVEVTPPMPSGYVGWKKIDTAELWSEIPVKTEVITTQGETAVKEREEDDSYGIEMRINLTIPKPNQSEEELAEINPHLPKILNDFSGLVNAAEVSPFFHHLYELKTARIQQNVTRFDRILSRHNLYDCETVLQIKHPDTGEKVLMVQGEMDVVSDGSDGDRWPELDDYISMSQYYQPFTSYGWSKRSNTPNPLLARWEEKLKEYEDRFAIKGLSIEENRFLREKIEEYKAGIADMKGRSFLIAEADPFFVLPLSFLGRKDENEFGPGIGDYGVIIYEDGVYPVIAGDAGPSWKFGEASLRVARHLNEKASPYNRPVSDLKVTYLIFPGSADENRGPPDLEAWHQKCSELLEGIGGLSADYSLHQWEDLIAKRLEEIEAKKAAEAEAEAAAENAENEESETPESETSEETGDDAQ